MTLREENQYYPQTGNEWSIVFEQHRTAYGTHFELDSSPLRRALSVKAAIPAIKAHREAFADVTVTR